MESPLFRVQLYGLRIFTEQFVLHPLGIPPVSVSRLVYVPEGDVEKFTKLFRLVRDDMDLKP